MKKKCTNKGKASTSESIFSSTKEYEHCGIKAHDIDHCYSLQPKFHTSKFTNNKDGKGKGGHEGGMVFNLKIKLQVRLIKVVTWPFITPICVQVHSIVFH